MPPDSVVQSVLEAYERGQTIDALKRAAGFAPLNDWAGVPGCSLAGRIAANAGGIRLAAKLATRLWRTDKNHPLAQFEYGVQLLQWRGPLAFWLTARTWPESPDWPPELRAEFLALKSRVASEFREFNTAEQLIQEAESLAPRTPWVGLQRAHLLERLEKVEEALEAAAAACQLHPHPFYRPGVQTMAHLLQLLDRDQEAVQLLREADNQIQNAHLCVQLFSLFAETQQWPAAEAALERYVALSPLMEPPAKVWLQGQRARVAYQLGNRTKALESASGLPDPFHRQFAEKLAHPAPSSEQIRLAVPFIRQQFKTCAPATLAALGRFWKIPAEPLALVEAFCYDGTPSWQQRDWAEHHGWLVREFRVTWDSALALVTQGIPFAITTVEATSGHMQAVIGFDRCRSTLWLRDPSQPCCLEAHAETFLDRYRAFGPRGLVFLPAPEAARLNRITLPDVDLYDELHTLSLALSCHNRQAAQTALEQLESKWPGHAITWEARLDLATYDANAAEEVRCLDQLLELFPGDAARILQRLHGMRGAAREERLEFLQAVSARKTADPALFVELASHLLADASQQAGAEHWLRRALRARPMDSGVMVALAQLRWSLGRFDEATELYRFGATVEGYREPLYQSWFVACRQVRQTDTALAHLTDRFRRLGNRSAQPALTLAWALRELEQPEQAREVLASAVQLRPDDGGLMIRAAALNARLGAGEPAVHLLNTARGKVRENDWLRAAVEIAEVRFDAKGVLRLCRELLTLEPLAVDAHAGVARSLAQLEGRALALTHLKAACIQHPHHCGLQRLLIDWLRRDGLETLISPAREFLRISPRDAWARRELAWALASLNQLDEALAEAEAAQRIEPRNSASAALLGAIHEKLLDGFAARRYFREALVLNVDNCNAITGLLRLANTDDERRTELAFIERELIRQVVRGDGLLAFMEAARPVLEPEALLKILRQAHAERPELWHTWSALIMQLDHLGQHEAALPLARKATERFPHLPRTWLDLATLHRRCHETEAEITAAQRAFEINPAWNQSAFVLADALERHHSLGEARTVYERALKHAPADPQFQVRLASVLWRLRQTQEALDGVAMALRWAPDADWAWNLLTTWSRECGQPEKPAEVARALTRERPGEVYGWLNLARALVGATELDERLKSVNRALELNPCAFEAWDLKAQLLAEALQFDAAGEACAAGATRCAGQVFMLRGRQAWVDAQRDRLPEAISRMRAVLADNAGYAWGWQQLASWLASRQLFADAEAAIQQLLKLQPKNPWAQRQLGLVRLKQGDKPEAQAVFNAVLDASPTDQSAAENLFNLQLEVGNLTGAAETLRRMQTHQPGARTLAREVMLNTRTGNPVAALNLFSALCRQSDPDPWPVQAAADTLKKAGLTDGSLRILKQVLLSGSANQQVGATAIQLLLDKRQDLRAMRLFGRIHAVEARYRAAAVMARGLGNLNARLSLQILLWRHREIFFKDDAAWGQVGYALSRFKRLGAVVEWMADWRSRPNVEPWMLFNLCHALRHLGRYSEAGEVATFAVQKWGYRRPAGADSRLFLAVEKALAGSIDGAMDDLQRVHARDDVQHDRQLLALAKALVEFQQSPLQNRAQQFKAVRQQLATHFSARNTLRAGRDVRRTFRRAGKLFAQQGAGPGARAWFFWKLNWQWSLLPLAPFGLILGLFPPVLLGLMLWVVVRKARRK